MTQIKKNLNHSKKCSIINLKKSDIIKNLVIKQVTL